MSREMLVTTFVCMRCGSNLNLSYDLPKQRAVCVYHEPTGAAMVKHTVGVHPCPCTTEPLDEFRRALLAVLPASDFVGVKP